MTVTGLRGLWNAWARELNDEESMYRFSAQMSLYENLIKIGFSPYYSLRMSNGETDCEHCCRTCGDALVFPGGECSCIKRMRREEAAGRQRYPNPYPFCCLDENRNVNGGCDSCGDPAL